MSTLICFFIVSIVVASSDATQIRARRQSCCGGGISTCCGGGITSCCGVPYQQSAAPQMVPTPYQSSQSYGSVAPSYQSGVQYQTSQGYSPVQNYATAQQSLGTSSYQPGSASQTVQYQTSSSIQSQSMPTYQYPSSAPQYSPSVYPSVQQPVTMGCTSSGGMSGCSCGSGYTQCYRLFSSNRCCRR
ncbi:hypothetical protein Tcan_03218 [Toxocara canis]|uniref:Uncharacterized protein n=1 Tax=Toxocara canis TaxID=6265 RepID=A0A0B2W1M7_TOXCA|nr:hypothetical protein Tcan_03218 [Toxocara canis]